MSSDRWSILVHGGAKTVRPERQAANRAGCIAATEAGRAVLEAGGSAVDAVVAAIRVLEDDPSFNAGYGAVLNSDGEPELDAALMDGTTLDVGAVAAVKGVRDPIAVAHAMLRDQPALLVGEGAYRYAVEKGATLCDPKDLTPPQVLADEACDTVGCVALDRQGRLAAGTSTGGLSGVRPGRVGDSPLPGCGLAADDRVGAASFSGDGESIIRLTLAARLLGQMTAAPVQVAAEAAIADMPRVGGEAGCIVLDPQGRPGMAHNSQHFAVGFADWRTAPQAFLTAQEFRHGR